MKRKRNLISRNTHVAVSYFSTGQAALDVQLKLQNFVQQIIQFRNASTKLIRLIPICGTRNANTSQLVLATEMLLSMEEKMSYSIVSCCIVNARQLNVICNAT